MHSSQGRRMNEPLVREKRTDGVCVWTINRPERRNALSLETLRALARLAQEVALDPNVRLVVITGAGERAFSAGADLKERLEMDEQQVREFLRVFRAALAAID